MDIKKLGFFKTEKKGATHIGIILSFALFVTFIFFLFIVLKPIIIVHDIKELQTGTLIDQVITNTSDYVAKVNIEILVPMQSGKDCWKMPPSSFGEDLISTSNMTAKELGGGKIEYEWQNNREFVTIGTNKSIFVVYESDRFPDTTIKNLCSAKTITQEHEYKVGIIRTRSYVFEEDLNKLITEYENNYDSLRNYFGLESGTDFSFILKKENGELLQPGEVPESLNNVYSEEKLVRYMDLNYDLRVGTLIVLVW